MGCIEKGVAIGIVALVAICAGICIAMSEPRKDSQSEESAAGIIFIDTDENVSKEISELLESNGYEVSVKKQTLMTATKKSKK